MKSFLLALVVVLFAMGGSQAEAQTSPVTVACVMQAAHLQNIPFQIILGFLKTEGGRLGMESRNSNGSYDLGPMQINSAVWVPKLAKMQFGGDQRAAWIALRDFGCYNIHIGAWIFRQYLDEAHGNYADAVGFYNSHSDGPKQRYEARYAANFAELFGLPEH